MTEDGVKIEFISNEKLGMDSFDDKLEFVLDKVKNNHVLVLEETWNPEERSMLIQYSMEQAEESFPGVEFWALDSPGSKIEKARNLFYKKVLNENKRRGITIVGNSRVMEKVKDERDSVSFLAKMNEGGSS